MKKYSQIALLYILNWLIFISLFATKFFNAVIFKIVTIQISGFYLPESIRTLLMVLWMIVPQTLLLVLINQMYFQLKPKKFILTQLFFAATLVVVLYLALASL